MRIFKSNRIGWVLLVAVGLASSGCYSAMTIAHPTWDSVAGRVREGDSVDLVMESGEKRTVDVTGVWVNELRAGYAGGIAYEEIETLQLNQKNRWANAFSWRPKNSLLGGLNFGNCAGANPLGIIALVGVVVVVDVIAQGVAGLAEVARRW